MEEKYKQNFQKKTNKKTHEKHLKAHNSEV